MFFRMIKKDLKDGKGLNVIILLFMVIVSTLITASMLLIFANTRGVAVSRERCKPYDALIGYQLLYADRDRQRERMEEIIKELYPDARIEHSEGITFDSTNIDYEGIDLNRLSQSFGSRYHVLIRQPRNMNLVYDQDNSPFYVENGKIAIPYAFSAEYGLKIGDEFFITMPNGKQYGFEVSHVTRDPIHDFVQRFILSDADYEFLSAQAPQKLGVTGFQTDEEFAPEDQKILNSKLAKDEEYGTYFKSCLMDGHYYSNSALISALVMFFLCVTGGFMLLIIFFAIRFTIRSMLKKEERELGIMKALGTDSCSFRMLVAAKYVAFAVTGGIVGAILGVIAGGMLIGRFYYNISYSLSALDFVVAIVATICTIGMVMLFILLSMRRIDKISVMDVLSGEARQERIRHSDRFQLNRRKKMGIPLFLALSDILGHFKRYVLLFIAFTIGSIVVILNIQVRDSVISSDFLYQFYTFKQMDFGASFDEATYNELSLGTGRGDLFIRNFEAMMMKEGIDVTLEMKKAHNAKMIFGDLTEMVLLNFGFDPEGLRIRKGGQIPKLRNEILMDYDTAGSFGLAVGDTVIIEYDKYNEDRLATKKTQEEFVITGFVDRLSKFNEKDVIMAKEFSDAPGEGSTLQGVGIRINVPDSEKAAVIERMKILFPDQIFDTEVMVATGFLGMYNVLFTFMRNLMIVVVAGVLAFLAVMYQTIFMKDEEPEIALLASAGFEEKSTKGWQFLRMMILFGVAMLLSLILTPTVVVWLIGALFKMILGLTGFGFTRGFLKACLWTIFITAMISVVMLIVLRKIRNIEIWRIRNE